MNARELLAAATPRPWHIDEDGNDGLPWIVENGAFAGKPEDTRLIVAAVNEYEALLELEAFARGVAERYSKISTSSNLAAGLARLQESLGQLDQLRRT